MTFLYTHWSLVKALLPCYCCGSDRRSIQMQTSLWMKLYSGTMRCFDCRLPVFIRTDHKHCTWIFLQYDARIISTSKSYTFTSFFIHDWLQLLQQFKVLVLPYRNTLQLAMMAMLILSLLLASLFGFLHSSCVRGKWIRMRPFYGLCLASGFALSLLQMRPILCMK